MTESITTDELPLDVTAVIDVLQYEEEADFPVERGYFWNYCSSAENGNPLFWDDDVAAALTDGPVAPPSMLSAWFRPHHWAPGPRRAEGAAPGALRHEGGVRPPRSDHERLHHDVLRPDPPRRPHHEWADPPFGERHEDHARRHRAVLGDRRRVPQPRRRARRRGDLDRVRLPQGRRAGSRRRRRDHVDHAAAARRGPRGRRAAAAHLRRHRHHRGARRVRRPRLAADAPRPQVRGGAQRRPRHLPQHHRTGGVLRALHHRLDRADRAARAAGLQHAQPGVPRRDDGDHRHGHEGGERRRRLRLGRARLRAQRRRRGPRHGRARVAIPITPDDNPWARRGERWLP